jgi:hypothetical protein
VGGRAHRVRPHNEEWLLRVCISVVIGDENRTTLATAQTEPLSQKGLAGFVTLPARYSL